MHTTIQFILAPATLSGVVSLVLSYVLIRVSPFLHLNAQPRPDRWHTKATPNTGGVAVFSGCAVAYLLFAPSRYLPIALGSAGVWLLGVIDDRLRLRPLEKLISQAIIVLATVLVSGTRPLTPWFPVNLLIAVIWILGVTNAFNLIDNMDGLCAGVAIIIAVVQSLVLGLSGDLSDARLFAIVGGAFAGFLVFNFNPARIFMGDGGSLFAGFYLSALTLVSPLAHTRLVAGGVFYPLMLFAYPLFDTALVSVLRRVCGRPVSEGGRDHSSHRLVSIGLNERHVTYFLWGLTFSGAMIGLLLSAMPLYAIGAAIILVVFAGVLGIFLATLPAYPLDLTPQISRLSRWVPQINAGLTLLVDCSGIGLALFLTYISRYDGQIPAGLLRQLSVAVPVTMLCYVIVALIDCKIWRVNWMYFSLIDTFLLVRTLCITAGLSYLVLTSVCQLVIPRGILLVFAILAIALIVTMRSSLRLLRELVRPKINSIRRIAIFGTGDLAAATLNLLRTTRFANGVPVMLLAEDDEATLSTIAGLRVHSLRDGIQRLQRRYQCCALLFPEGSGTRQTKDGLKEMCRSARIEFLSIDLRVRPEGMQEELRVNPILMADRRKLAHTIHAHDSPASAGIISAD